MLAIITPANKHITLHLLSRILRPTANESSYLPRQSDLPFPRPSVSSFFSMPFSKVSL